MRLLAYCDARYEQATRLAVGARATVLVAPPSGADEWRASQPAEADLLYFNFHAGPGVPAWLTTDGLIALTVDDLAVLDLSHAVVFMVNCYAGGGMLDALKACQPRAIIGGDGENLGALGRLAGADLLGRWVRLGLEAGMSPRGALGLAKGRLRIGVKTASVRDALNFKVL